MGAQGGVSGQAAATGEDRTERALVTGLVIFGTIELAIGVLMAAAPGTFFDKLGAWPPENHHYIRDLSTFTVALGVALLAAVRLESWRVPVLAFALIHFFGHSISHLVDINESDPESIGAPAFASLAVGTAVLIWLLRTALRHERSTR